MLNIHKLFQRIDRVDIPGTQWIGRDHFEIYGFENVAGVPQAYICAQFRHPKVLSMVFYIPKHASLFLHKITDNPLLLVSLDNKVLQGINGYSVVEHNEQIKRVSYDGHIIYDYTKHNF